MSTEARVTDLTDDTFPGEVLAAALPSAVFFRADWSGWSHIMEPVVERLALETAGRLRVFRVDADRQRATARLCSVRRIPALLFFADGRVVARRDGPVPATDVAALQQTFVRAADPVRSEGVS
jgi:thioredoxin-like negative regulator of GroEL